MEEKSHLDQLTERMLTPARSGVYLTRGDMIKLSKTLGATVGISDKKLMFKDLLKFVDNDSEFVKFLEILETFIIEQEEVFHRYIEEYPTSGAIYESWIEKTQNTRKYLNTIKDEVLV